MAFNIMQFHFRFGMASVPALRFKTYRLLVSDKSVSLSFSLIVVAAASHL